MPVVPVVLDGFRHLETAIRLGADGDVEGARASLAHIDGSAIQHWYIEHAQVAGTRRVAILRTRQPLPPVEKLDRPYPTAAAEAEVFRRDGFRCRYCQRKILSRSVLKAFHAVVGDAVFQMGTTNALEVGILIV